MPKMHVWNPKIKKYSACGPFTRHKKRIRINEHSMIL